VVKDRGRGYRPDRTQSAWRKVRAHHTAEAVVGGVVGSVDAPEACLLGAETSAAGSGWSGRTVPLTLPARRELGVLLVAPDGAHPWPPVLPGNRFGQ
jgi:hypothetical protein